MFISMFSTFSFASELPPLPLRVVVNWDEIKFPDEKPFIDEKGRTQTPARFIGEALGADVTWDPATQTATFVLGSKKLELYIGKREYKLNDEVKKMDTEALLKNGRTFVPARYVAEAFGATVEWDKSVRTVYISMSYEEEDKTGTEIRGGFVVPKDRKLTIMNDYTADVKLQINVLMDDLDGQIEEMAEILSQKCDKATVEQIVEYVKQKKEEGDYLADKYIYDKKSQRYIHIEESRALGISVLFLNASHTQNYKKYIGE
jgi:hypothetical protein